MSKMTTRRLVNQIIILLSVPSCWHVASFVIVPRHSSTRSQVASTKVFANYGGDDQGTEAIKSLVQYHEGTWKGTARSFTVVPDTAAGIVQRKTSPEYEVAVRVGLDADKKFSLQETFSWDDHVSARSLPLDECNMDVDSVDASYSLDTALPDFPAAISGTNKICQFIIEHCIAASEDRRMKCFAMYGVDQSLQRVIVCDESKVQIPRMASDVGNAFTAADLLEMQNDVDRLVDKLTGGSQSSNGKPIDKDYPLPRPEDNMIKGTGTVSEGFDGNTRIPPSDDPNQKLSIHDISLLELSSGVWLGDAIIRDRPMVASSPVERGRGFGEKRALSNELSTQFGEWEVGVQKVAWRWMWNFGEEMRLIVDVGKAMGTQLAECMSTSLAGSVCVNESLSRRIAKKDRMVYLDLNNELVGFLSGPVSIQLPRYLNFDAETNKNVRPFFSEFCVYQRAGEAEDAGPTPSDEKLPELYCSKIGRVYNYEGKLKQGCTSFYTFKRFGIDGEIPDE